MKDSINFDFSEHIKNQNIETLVRYRDSFVQMIQIGIEAGADTTTAQSQLVEVCRRISELKKAEA